MTRRAPLAVLLCAAVGLGGCAGTGAGGSGRSPDDTGGDDNGGVDTGACDPSAQEAAPLRRLSPREYRAVVADLFPGTPVPEVDLPDDPEVDGLDDNAAGQEPSALLVASWQEAAVDVAEAVLTAGADIPCAYDLPVESARSCGTAWTEELARRAFRRPLTADEATRWSGFYSDRLDEEGFEVAAGLTIAALLQSPAFLYLPVEGEADADGRVALDGYELAARLALLVWGTTPDEALYAAATAGRLDSADGLEAETRRMLADERARAGLLAFADQWLDADAIASVAPDQSVYTDWRNSARRSMREELDAMVLRELVDGDGTLAALLTTTYTEVDDDLALLYGYDPDALGWDGVTWLPLALDAEQRAGILTTPGWLAATSHAVDPSPVKRGVFVLRRLLCRSVGTPPGGVTTATPEDDGSGVTTNRERYAQHTDDPACSGCHVSIDGVGFGFEHYDATGAWRDTDAGQPVDASGVLTVSDVSGSFDGAPELAARLAASEDVHDCFARLVTQYGLARTPGGADTCALGDVQAGFREDGRVDALIVGLVRSDLFRYRVAP